MRRVLITGAAGNLGSRLARRLLPTGDRLRLMIHRKPPPGDLAQSPQVEIAPADLARPETLADAVAGVDCIVHFAGVLFHPRPERFLPITNVQWFGNLVDAAITAGVGRIILISFPQVEGPTTPDHPATDRLDREPLFVHARTRLEAEKLLFARTRGTGTTPIVIRSATVYGPGILMVEAARRLARLRLLRVWQEPTWYHFIQIDDFLDAVAAAIAKPGIQGIYPVGDDKPITIQEFLDAAAEVWGRPHPWRMPWWMIYTAAASCEIFASIFGTISPLTRDFVGLGRVDHCCDTKRMRAELLPKLAWPTFELGKSTLR
ncbi:MAG TPA: NAD(P)-dependent oxidoreductase [Candidatus Binataceae bacterium]|nr:NAD(P)-dependent oxidoreductase [Candidatus Binataceae bacterium]